MRNAILRRSHRERAQPVEREKWGVLEKHKVREEKLLPSKMFVDFFGSNTCALGLLATSKRL